MQLSSFILSGIINYRPERHGKSCICCKRYAILVTYLSDGKGGQNACYGEILNSRGGKPGTKGVNGYGSTLDTTQGASSVQVWRRVSHHARRLRTLPNHPQNHAREKRQFNSGKLTISLSATWKHLTKVSQAVIRCFVPMLPMSILPDIPHAWQHRHPGSVQIKENAMEYTIPRTTYALVIVMDHRYFLWCVSVALLEWHYAMWTRQVQP